MNILLFSVYVIGSMFLFVACAKNAPEGYEDETGFHFGEPPKKILVKE
jgi:hypothetical protein